MHQLNITDPELLLRAVALDQATRDLTTEATARSLKLGHTTRHAWPAPGNHPDDRRNHSAQLAAQDQPDTPADPARPGTAHASNTAAPRLARR